MSETHCTHYECSACRRLSIVRSTWLNRYSGSCPAWPLSFTPGGKTHTCRCSPQWGRDVSIRWGSPVHEDWHSGLVGPTFGTSPSGLHVAGSLCSQGFHHCCCLTSECQTTQYGRAVDSKNAREARHVLPGLILSVGRRLGSRRVVRISWSQPNHRTRLTRGTLHDSPSKVSHRPAPTCAALKGARVAGKGAGRHVADSTPAANPTLDPKPHTPRRYPL